MNRKVTPVVDDKLRTL